MGRSALQNDSSTFRTFAARFLADGDTFIDIGARNGVGSTVLAAKIVGDCGQVIAIEPDKLCFARLKHNVTSGGNENVECLNLFVAGTSDHLPTLKLDRLCETRGPISLIRISAPGYELELLRSLGSLVTDGNAPSFIFHLAKGTVDYVPEIAFRLIDLLQAADYCVEQHGTIVTARAPNRRLARESSESGVALFKRQRGGSPSRVHRLWA